MAYDEYEDDGYEDSEIVEVDEEPEEDFDSE